MKCETCKKRVKTEEKQIARLIKRNTKDLQEMAERGKELVKIARIMRGCKDLISADVYKKFIDVINKFELRCTLNSDKRNKENGVKR
jgi:RecJ-like exonuclease